MEYCTNCKSIFVILLCILPSARAKGLAIANFLYTNQKPFIIQLFSMNVMPKIHIFTNLPKFINAHLSSITFPSFTRNRSKIIAKKRNGKHCHKHKGNSHPRKDSRQNIIPFYSVSYYSGKYKATNKSYYQPIPSNHFIYLLRSLKKSSSCS